MAKWLGNARLFQTILRQAKHSSLVRAVAKAGVTIHGSLSLNELQLREEVAGKYPTISGHPPVIVMSYMSITLMALGAGSLHGESQTQACSSEKGESVVPYPKLTKPSEERKTQNSTPH